MKKKFFLVILVLIIVITNLILFKNFYNTKVESNNMQIQIKLWK